MRMIVPPPHGTDSTQRFLTYRYYLRSLAGLAGFAHSATDIADVYPVIAGRVAALPSCRHRPAAAFDEQALRRSLTNAWGTELLLQLSGEYAVEDELLRVTNNWAAVQLYYVFYHATQALILARGDSRPDTHQKTQKLFMDMWVMRPLDCAPWTLGHGAVPTNVPKSHTVETKITTVARPRTEADFLNYVLKALFTTRKEAIPGVARARREAKQKADRQAWEREEAERIRVGRRPRIRPRFSLPILTDAEKAAEHASVRCYTTMDILWRLRTRTNYSDGLMFIEGPIDEAASAELNRDMRHLASATMLLYELHICRQIGVDAIRALATSWLDRNKVSSSMGVGQRLGLVLAA